MYSTVVMDFPLGQSLVMDFSLGQSLVVALLQYYFGRRLGIVFIWVDGFGDRFYFGSTTRVAPTGIVLFWLTVGVAIMGFVSINVVMLIIRFQPFARYRLISLSHFQYAQIYMPCYGMVMKYNPDCA